MFVEKSIPTGNGIEPEISIPKIALVNYYARTSLASIAGARPSKALDFSAISSAFQKRMVERDFRKDLLRVLAASTFDVLLLDFVDDRFNVLRFPDGGIVTDSSEFRRAKIDIRSLGAAAFRFHSQVYRELWVKGLESLMSHAEEYGYKHKILVNKVYFSKTDDLGTLLPDQDGISAFNSHLDWVYSMLEKYLDAIQFIRYHPELLQAKRDYRWGLLPFHFVEAVESRCVEGVRCFHAMSLYK